MNSDSIELLQLFARENIKGASLFVKRFLILFSIIALIVTTSVATLAFPDFLSSKAQQENQAPLTLVVMPVPFSQTQPRIKLPEEPEEFDLREIEAYYDWRNDMFFRQFDLTGSGTVNYMTARRTYKVWLDDFGTPVVITEANPLFYWVDTNRNGEFEQELGEMWSDPYEDGLTGNERPYDSSDLQDPPSKVPSWSAPTPSPKLPPCDARFGC